MKPVTLLPLLLSSVLATPNRELQTVLGGLSDFADVPDAIFREIAAGVERVGHNVLDKAKMTVEQWTADGTEYVKQHDMVCKSSWM